MKNKFRDPSKDVYLWGRFCDYFVTSHGISENQKRKEAYKRLKEYYGMPITKLRIHLEKRRRIVGGGYPGV